MAKDALVGALKPSVFSIPVHRSFADSLVAGILKRFGRGPADLAEGRILLPNNRAVRTVTDAFVRASGTGLILPRLIPIGDPDLDERIGGAFEALGDSDIPPALDPLERLLFLAQILRSTGETAGEALRLAGDLGRAIDALLIEEVEPGRLKDAVGAAEGMAQHWQHSLARLEAILDHWPKLVAARNCIELAERRNRLLRRLAERWSAKPPTGFTVAAGIATAAPAVAELLRTIARLPNGLLVLAGLQLPDAMSDEEWDALAPDEQKCGEETHPQFHLKLLLERLEIHRHEVQPWRTVGRSASPPARARAVANAMVSAQFTSRWQGLPPTHRRLSGVRAVELPTVGAEAQAIALALREAIEEPGQTAALVTADRDLAERVSALLARWQIQADDSAGRPLSQTPPGALLLGLTEAAVEGLAPVPLLALLKHPLVGGDDARRLAWLDDVRSLDLALRGPRPAAGLSGLDRHFQINASGRIGTAASTAWKRLRAQLAPVDELIRNPVSLRRFAEQLAAIADTLSGGRAWSGTDGKAAAELLLSLQSSPSAEDLTVSTGDVVPVLRQLLDGRSVRPGYGGHPRVFIWGLLEARLQHADFMVLGGLNEGSWPASVAPDPWLAPKIRAELGLPGLEFRVGLSAHDFASALGAPNVLVTRSRRDAKAPTVASRFWLRLEAMTGGMVRDIRLERLAAALDDPGEIAPASRPAPCPARDQRPRVISVTAVDRLKADPFAFYARSVLRLPSLDPIDTDHTAAWKGSAVHRVLEEWFKADGCEPDRLLERARVLLAGDSIHPMLRALWQPRLFEALEWVAAHERELRGEGRRQIAAEDEGRTTVAGVTLKGTADRLDLLADGSLAIVDYKTGKPPTGKAVAAGFALQLGLLGAIARANGFPVARGLPSRHEYWSLAKYGDEFGRCVQADKEAGAEAFVDQALATFATVAGDYLTGEQPFIAKLHPAFAPYGEYDQLMRLEEWYGRE